MTAKKTETILTMCCVFLSSCTYMSASERYQLYELHKKGITVNHPGTDWKKPANSRVAGMLNLLPGMGNFYLGVGDGADYFQLVYGVINFATWPYSMLWGVPAAMYDARTINERELVRYYDRQRSVVHQQPAVQQQPLRQSYDGDVYYPGSGYYYNGYFEQNNDDSRHSGASCGGACGNVPAASYHNGAAVQNRYNGNIYNNSSYNVTPYNDNAYTEEYFDRQEEDSHKYDWERYYYR